MCVYTLLYIYIYIRLHYVKKEERKKTKCAHREEERELGGKILKSDV